MLLRMLLSRITWSSPSDIHSLIPVRHIVSPPQTILTCSLGKATNSKPTVDVNSVIPKVEEALDGKRNAVAPTVEYLALQDGTVALVHVFQVQNDAAGTWYAAHVDAHSGELISVTDFVSHATVGSVKFILRIFGLTVAFLCSIKSCLWARRRFWRVWRPLSTRKISARHRWDGILVRELCTFFKPSYLSSSNYRAEATTVKRTGSQVIAAPPLRATSSITPMIPL